MGTIVGSSPIEIDYKRQLRAEQWARFCGRHSCAELIEKWSRTRNLDKVPFTNKDQGDGTVIGRARANSTIQPISQVNLAPIKTERGKFYIQKSIGKILMIIHYSSNFVSFLSIVPSLLAVQTK